MTEFVLRILNGRLAGTDKPLPAEGRTSIGHEFWQDVVIREPSVKGIAVDLEIDAEGRAQVTVLTGEASMLGSHLPAGETALLPPYMPMSIGGVAFAWGEAESDRWAEAGGLARAVPTPPALPPNVGDQAAAVIGEAGERLGSVFSGKRAWALAAAAAIGVVAIGALPAADALGLRADPPTRVDRALADAGLSALTVTDDPARGGVVVSGVVANEAERGKAEKILRDSYVPGSVNVQTGGELAAASADVARIRGLQASAKPIGRDGVELRTTRLNSVAERQQLTQAVRADVTGVRRLVLRDDLPPPPEVPLKSVQDVTKKVSTVVSGDPSYIQTVDGARYFSGAMMPSGHRLVGIQGNMVVLEKNGRETRVVF